jgi:hypothetical protein
MPVSAGSRPETRISSAECRNQSSRRPLGELLGPIWWGCPCLPVAARLSNARQTKAESWDGRRGRDSDRLRLPLVCVGHGIATGNSAVTTSKATVRARISVVVMLVLLVVVLLAASATAALMMIIKLVLLKTTSVLLNNGYRGPGTTLERPFVGSRRR